MLSDIDDDDDDDLICFGFSRSCVAKAMVMVSRMSRMFRTGKKWNTH